jgi:diguanylate cyclase (GGDEF)-like protein
LKALRRNPKTASIPVVFLTSNDDQKLIAEAFQQGAVDFLRKPIYPMEFQARIKSVLKTQAMLHRLRYLSHNDPLTGLPNRNGMCQWIQHAAEHAADFPLPHAVLVIGIDRISNITDLMGYGASDELMRAVAKRLQSILTQSTDLDRCCNRFHLARGSCDSFALLMTGIESPRTTMGLAASLVESIASGYKIGSENQFVSASVGIATSRDANSDFHELLRCADIAFQDARRAGRSHVQMYDPSMEEVLRRKLELEDALRSATKSRDFQLDYQPVFNLQTKQSEFVEAIIRWEHPHHGNVPLHFFRSIAEENGLMGEIASWALSSVCGHLSQWSFDSPSDAPRRVSLDLSRKQLLHPQFLAAASDTIQDSRVRSDRIQFEISEAEIIHDPIGTLDALNKLRELGVRILVDDFGTTFPSFHYLEQLPVDGIKLNRGMIQDIEINPILPKLLEMLARQAADLNLSIVVDGVDRETQAKALTNIGFRWAQGEFFSKPMQAESLIPFLTEWNQSARHKSRGKPVLNS